MSQSLSIDVASLSAAATTSKSDFTVQAASDARIKVSTKALYASAVRGTQGRGQRFRVTNVGTKSMKLDSSSFSFTGTDASSFALVAGTLPKTLKPGAGASFTIALKPSVGAPTTRVLTATLNVRAAGSSTVLGRVDARGIATIGEGGNNEPSLARLVDLFKLSINVGDSDPDTTTLDIPNGASTDEIFAPRFQHVGTDPVEITPLAVYLSPSTTFAGRIGYYTPGSPDSRTEIAAVNGVDAQNVTPTLNGATKFDPGSQPFSLWGEAPIFRDSAGKPREIYGEDALNTWDSNAANRRKVRVYPYKENGKAVANAYVVTFEDYELANDQNDYVYVLRNVTALASRPEIGLIAEAGQPEANRLVMNRIETNTSQYFSDVHDTATVQVINTGNQDLNISSIAIGGADASDFQIVAGSGATTLSRNDTLDVTVKFVAHAGTAIHNANLVINSNDTDEPALNVALSGVWQAGAEVNGVQVPDEPTLQTIVNALGYRVNTGSPSQLENHGKTEAVGDEVLSGYWRQADANLPVTVEEVGGWHQTNTNSHVAYYDRGHPWYYVTDPRYNAATNGTENSLFVMAAHDTQTFLPHLSNSTDYAHASFTPTGAFGMRVDGELSDDSLNVQAAGDVGGHHVRFYPVRDSTGALVPNAYLMAQDFSSINFDYQDHVLLLMNVRPADRNASVEAIGGYGTTAGITLDWNDVDEARSYNVYRSDKTSGTYTRVASDVLVSQFVDAKAKSNRNWYYRVVAVNSNDSESLPINITVRRPA